MKKFFLLIFIINISLADNSEKYFKFGADVFFEKYLYLIEGKRIGVVCNQASVLTNRVHIVDSLLNSGANIVALFSPEHGIRGEYQAGVKYEDEIDPKTGIIVYSLYGKTQKPTKEMLTDIDLLLFDLQDVGSRFYTYTITMYYVMQSAAENNLEFVLLDRPNPINGVDIEGPVLDLNLKSNVGIFPLPVRHGLTIGEIAKMIIDERWLKINAKSLIKIIPMENWNREKYFDELELSWIPPSPNLKTVKSTIVYPGTCFLEATNVSEGRGTENPFEVFGAPWINGIVLAEELNKKNMSGVFFKPIEFIPEHDNKSKTFKYSGEKCYGVKIDVVDRYKFKPVSTGLNIVKVIYELYPENIKFNYDFLSKLVGVRISEVQLNSENFLKSIKKVEDRNLKKYRKLHKKHQIY